MKLSNAKFLKYQNGVSIDAWILHGDLEYSKAVLIEDQGDLKKIEACREEFKDNPDMLEFMDSKILVWNEHKDILSKKIMETEREIKRLKGFQESLNK